MFINSHSSIHKFYNNKILRYYLSINNNHRLHKSSSSLSSISSSLLTQSRNTFKITTVKKSYKQTDSLSSLSTTSFSSSITIILHALQTRNNQQEKIHYGKKFFNKNHSRYNNSSSSISLSRLINKNKTKQKSILSKRNGLNTNRYSVSNHDQELFVSPRLSRYNKDKSLSESSFNNKNSLSNSISHLNNIILTETNNDENIENFNCDQSTQTDNYSSIQQQYQYKNLRRVNSDLLDYIFIPIR